MSLDIDSLLQGTGAVLLGTGSGSLGIATVVSGTPPAAAAGRRPHTQHEGWAAQGAWGPYVENALAAKDNWKLLGQAFSMVTPRMIALMLFHACLLACFSFCDGAVPPPWPPPNLNVESGRADAVGQHVG